MKNKNHKYILIFISSLLLFFTSHFSPLYEFNDWMDSMVYTEVGKAWIQRGKIPYKDIFDHKGPLLFFIYGIGSFIKIGHNYIGIWIMQIINASFISIYAYKISNMFINTKKSLIASISYLLVMFGIIGNKRLIEKGGSPEEYITLLIMIILFYIIRAIKTKQEISNKEYIYMGISISCIFLLKFTLVIPPSFVILLYLFKDIKTMLKKILMLAIGFIPLIAITIIYFIVNNALSDLFKYYIWINLFGYSETGVNNFIGKLILSWNSFTSLVSLSYIYMALVVSNLIIVLNDEKMISEKFYDRFMIFSYFGGTILVSFISGREYSHYLIVVTPFLIFVFIKLLSLINNDIKIKKISIVITSIIIILFSVGSDNDIATRTRFTRIKETNWAKLVANEINKDKTMNDKKDNIILLINSEPGLAINELANISPKSKFFYKPGMKMEIADEEVESEIKSKNAKYVVVDKTFYQSGIIKKYSHYHSIKSWGNISLYKLK